MRLELLPWFIGVGVVALAVHFAGIRRGWYDQHGFDHVTHFLSGAGIMVGLQIILPWWLAWVAWVAGALGWEAWEYHYGKPSDLWHNWRNMVHDLAFGLLGAGVVQGLI